MPDRRLNGPNLDHLVRVSSETAYDGWSLYRLYRQSFFSVQENLDSPVFIVSCTINPSLRIMGPLPEELLSQICWYFGPGDGGMMGRKWVTNRMTLYRLMCTSRAFYRAARPILYNTVVIGEQMSDNRLETLLRVCIKYPDTVKLIHELHLGYVQPEENAVEEQLPDLDLLLSATSDICVSSDLRHEIQDGLRVGSDDALNALLLALCRHVEILCAEPDDLEHRLIRRLLEEAASPSCITNANTPLPKAGEVRPLQSLRVFHGRRFDPEEGFAFRTVDPILRLPMIEVFTGDMAMITPYEDGLPADFVSPIRYMDLREAIVHGECLDLLLEACPNLREIDIQLGSPRIGYSEISFPGLGDILRRRGSRIERFRFDAGEAEDMDLGHHRLGDLTGMRVLHTLHVDWEALFSEVLIHGVSSSSADRPDHLVNTLPESLEELRILRMPSSDQRVNSTDSQLLMLMEDKRFKKFASLEVRRSAPFSLPLPPSWRIPAPGTLRKTKTPGIFYRVDEGSVMCLERYK